MTSGEYWKCKSKMGVKVREIFVNLGETERGLKVADE